MLNKYIKCLSICLMVLTLHLPCAISAESSHPLEPMDLSSPRATLNTFMELGDTAYQHLFEIYQGTPSRAAVHQQIAIGKKMNSVLDMSKIPKALSWDIGLDGMLYLYEVLARLELPAAKDIPDAAAYAEMKNDKQANNKPVTWVIPHSEITLVRITEGPRTGQFLFSSHTVMRAKEFYEKTRSLPYTRDVPIKNYAEKRSYLSVEGWMISSRTIEAFPDWLKLSIYQQAVWKWIALAILIGMAFILVSVIHKFPILPTNKYLGNLSKPFAMLLIPLAFNLATQQLTLSGYVSESIRLSTELAYYFLLAWIAWTGSMSIAEFIIASPKILEQSLNASMLRLTARIIGIILVISIFFYVSSRFGVPLYGLFTGLGVGGLAIAMGAKSTIENFIGSINLFADRPVRVGDYCRYGEDPSPNWRRTGTIESIGIRSTRIRGIDNSLTTIPNADFSMMHIVNYTTRNKILLFTVLGLRYETTDDQLRFVIAMVRDMLLAHPRVVDEEPRVRFVGFGDFSLNVEIRVNINTSNRNEFRAVNEDIYLRIMKIVKDAGTGFAFPSSTVYHSRDEGMDEKLQKTAEAKVRAWCSAQELPFPNFSVEYRKKNRNTIAYPPEGSPDSSK